MGVRPEKTPVSNPETAVDTWSVIVNGLPATVDGLPLSDNVLPASADEPPDSGGSAISIITIR